MLRFSFSSLRARLLLLVLLATLPALGLTLHTGLEHRRQATERAGAEALRLAKYACRIEKNFIDSAHQLLASLAELREVRDRTPDLCDPIFSKMLKQNSRYVNIGAADPDGNIFCSAVLFDATKGGINIADRSYFRKALQSHSFSIGNHQIDRIARRPTVNVAYPVLNEAEQVQAVVFASLDLSLFIDFAAELQLPEGATLTVRDQDGTILTRFPDPGKWGSMTLPEAPVLKAILSKRGEGTAESIGVDNVKRMYAFTSLDGAPGSCSYLSVGIPTGVMLAESNFELARNMAGILLAALFAFVAAWFVGDLFMIRRVKALVSTTRRLATGELSARITQEAGSTGCSELDELGGALDEMAGSLERSTLKLRETEAQYRILVEEVPAITYIAALDDSRTPLYISPQIQVMLGFSADQWISDPAIWLKQLHHEDRERVQAAFLLCRSGTGATGFCSEYRLLAADGHEVWIRDEARVVRNFSGKQDTLHGIMRNITERKQAEENIRHSEDKYRTIFETTGTATIIIEEDMTISLANTEFIKLSGYSKEEVEQVKSWTEFFVEEDARRMEEYHRRRRIDPGYAPRDYQTRFIDRFGKIRYMLASVAMIPGSSKSAASFLDISEHKRANDALRKSEEQYRQFFEEDLTGDFIADAQGHLIAFNAAFTAIFGFESMERVQECTLSSLFRDAAVWEEFLKQLQAIEKLIYWEEELRGWDGNPVHVIANVIGIFDEQGNLTGMKGYLFDDTKRKKLEEQLRQSQKMEAIGRLAGGVAHDFNNMLTIISGYSEIVLDSLSQDDPLRKYIEEVRKAGERAATLTKQLLAFSRKQVLQPKVLNLNAAVANMEKMLRRLIGEDIHLSTILDPQLGHIKADPGQIEQILMNLAVNARDAMPKGGRLMIETTSVRLNDELANVQVGLQPGPYVMLSVSDSGTGMDSKTQSRIFEPFFTTKELGKGTGLGLPTVYGIVKQSGGHIWVYSELARGTTFKIYLPRVETEADLKRPPLIHSKIPRGTETILLVEDDEMVRGTIHRILERSGYRVIEAHNGSEALHMQEEIKEPIHLLVTDIIMPLMNGYELVKRLTPLRPHMKVLLVSGYTDEGMLLQGSLEPGMAFLQKPFTPETMARKVREVLDTPSAL